MSVTLNITVDSRPHEPYVLRAGEVATVGCSPWADISLPSVADLAEEHFRVDCRDTSCRVEALHGSLLRNGVKVDSAVLDDGDTLSAGRVDIGVRISGLTRDRGDVISLKLTDQEEPSIDEFFELLLRAELSSAGQEFVVSESRLETFDALWAAGIRKDACKFAVAVLPPCTAVSWAIEQFGHTSHLTGEDQDQLRDYVSGKRESITAEEIDQRIAVLSPKDPDAWLWKAARWSGGSLSMAGMPPVPPAPQLFAVAMSVAVALAAAQQEVDVYPDWLSVARELIEKHICRDTIKTESDLRSSA